MNSLFCFLLDFCVRFQAFLFVILGFAVFFKKLEKLFTKNPIKRRRTLVND